MQTILKTDKAYTAIDKINSNFIEVTSGAKIEGSITGNGDTFVYYFFPAKAGDYFHVQFPNGTWSTNRQRESYNKLVFGWRDNNDAFHSICEITREPWPIPDYGYDLYLSDEATNVKDAYLAFRAASGVNVSFNIDYLSKKDMKNYFIDEMADTVSKVRARQGNTTITLAVCSDIHYRDIQEGYRPFAPYAAPGMCLAMKELASRIRLDNIVCLGDGIDGLWSAEKGKMDARDIMTFLSFPRVPLLYVVGNHDDNRYYSNEGGDRSFTAKEIHSEFIHNVDERVSVGGSMQECNYYRDIDRVGIRLICLMSIDFNRRYRFTTETIQFLSNTFASMPEGYKAVIFTHTPLRTEHSYPGTSYPGGGDIETIINNNKDKFLFLYFGHTHFDNQYLSPFVEINIGCAKVYNTSDGTPGSTAPEDSYFCERSVGDAGENLWDVVVVDKSNSLLSCIRFGAGVDRYIHLENVLVSAGGNVTLTPSVISATSWHTKDSETDISVNSSGVATVAPGATPGTVLTVRASDADGNFEYWGIKVS